MVSGEFSFDGMLFCGGNESATTTGFYAILGYVKRAYANYLIVGEKIMEGCWNIRKSLEGCEICDICWLF